MASGSSRPAGSSRSRSASASPSISGMCMSRMPTSKRSPDSRSDSASGPEATATGSIPHDSVWSVRICRFVPLSSTTRTRRPVSCGTGPPRKTGRAPSVASARIVKEKVDPFPTSLTTSTAPPISSTSRLLIVRPRPVPP